jgi:hypothetical protein
MFVGIDEYDAPARSMAFGGRQLYFDHQDDIPPGAEKELAARSIKAAAIESFFNDSLFSILNAACGDGTFGCIDKYFLTGVLPAFRVEMSPLKGVKSISDEPQFHGICGLTDQQVKIFAQAYLYPLPDHDVARRVRSIRKFRKFCNGYFFARSADEDPNAKEKNGPNLDRLGNPHVTFQCLSMIKSGLLGKPSLGFHWFTSSPVLDQEKYIVPPNFGEPTNVLASVRHFAKFSLADLVQLELEKRQRAKILTNFDFTDLVMLSGKDRQMTISLLVYMGVLTRDKEPGVVRIPNKLMTGMVME